MAATRSARLCDCCRCPRLVKLREQVRESHPDYFAAPVPAWGSTTARLLIVGLAPGMHGANRSGRPFVGDSSGHFLFGSLARNGFASSADPGKAKLLNLRITNALKCLPPQNAPVAAELVACRDFLLEDIAPLRAAKIRANRVILCLGRIAHRAVAAALELPVPPFKHGNIAQLSEHLWLCDSYHPSRQNTNTGRLTEQMLDEVFAHIRRLLD